MGRPGSVHLPLHGEAAADRLDAGVRVGPGRHAAVAHLPLGSFGERLGLALFRIPAGQARDDGRLDRLLGAWPAQIPLAIEAQDPSWHVDETHARLRAAGATLVVTETDEAPDPPLTVTGPVVYVRLRREAYGTLDLDGWAARLEPFLADGRDAYAFFRHDERGITPGYARALASRLERYGPREPVDPAAETTKGGRG